MTRRDALHPERARVTGCIGSRDECGVGPSRARIERAPPCRARRRWAALLGWVVVLGCSSASSGEVFEATRTRGDGLRHHVTAHFVGTDLVVRSRTVNVGLTRVHAEPLCFLEFSGTLRFVDPDFLQPVPACYSNSVTLWPFRSYEHVTKGAVAAGPGQYTLSVLADADTALTATLQVTVSVRR